MGADFLLYSLPWTQLDESRQKCLHDAIDQMADEQVKDVADAVGSFDDESIPIVKKAIHAAVREYMELDNRRDTTTWRHGHDPVTRIYTGGLSWGEPPTDCVQTFDVIATCDPIYDLLERWALEESPTTAKIFELRDSLDNVTAALETCLAHFGSQMPKTDRTQRTKLAAKARSLLVCEAILPKPAGVAQVQHPGSLRDVLAEFCKDIEAAGRDQVAEDWPDLVVTYDKAITALQKSGIEETTAQKAGILH